MTVPADAPAAWLFLTPDTLPEAWRARARPAVYVPLLPDEARDILDGGAARPALSPIEQRLAGLATRGLTIDAMARELGVSTRTVGRRLAALRHRFGVATTVELALRLSAQGLTLADAGTPAVRGEAVGDLQYRWYERTE